jgi:hypothetical protein
VVILKPSDKHKMFFWIFISNFVRNVQMDIIDVRKLPAPVPDQEK